MMHLLHQLYISKFTYKQFDHFPTYKISLKLPHTARLYEGAERFNHWDDLMV